MKFEHSFGIIPLRKQVEWEVLLVQPHKGWWGIPKGHGEKGETGKQAAERELFEETGLKVFKYLTDEAFTEKYIFTISHQLINKTVTYYIAEVKGTVILQPEELKDYRWIELLLSVNLATYPETQKVLSQTFQLLNS